MDFEEPVRCRVTAVFLLVAHSFPQGRASREMSCRFDAASEPRRKTSAFSVRPRCPFAKTFASSRAESRHRTDPKIRRLHRYFAVCAKPACNQIKHTQDERQSAIIICRRGQFSKVSASLKLQEYDHRYSAFVCLIKTSWGLSKAAPMTAE